MLLYNTFWLKWWRNLAYKTSGCPERVRNSIDADVTEAALDILEFIDFDSKLFEKKQLINILDIGCGSGILSQRFFNILNETLHFYKFKMTLLDISHHYFKNISENFLKICANSTNLPFKDNTFDLIICYSSLQYFQKKKYLKNSIKEIYRLLSDNGHCLILAFPEANKKKDFIAGYKNTALSKEKIENNINLANKRLWLSREELKFILDKSGFNNIIHKDINNKILEHKYMFNIKGKKTNSLINN
jgi:ubiquinone/menaquinone biosynthesis C-methylase UbiE